MNSYKVSTPSSRQITIGRDEQGKQTTTITHRGGQNLASNETYLRALSVANSNIESARRDRARHEERVNARTNRINPVTGQADYVYTEEERHKSALAIRQLDDTIAYQQMQAQQQALQAQAEADAERANSVTEYETVAAINRRAGEIALENASKALAPLYTISGK
jgi:hypothetical protein